MTGGTTMVDWLARVLLALAVTVTVATARPVLRRLSRRTATAATSPDAGPPDYAALATPRFISAVGLMSLAAALAVGGFSNHPLIWLALVGPGVLQVCIDAVTTWLPLRLSQVLWAGTAGAVVVITVAQPTAGLRAIGGAAVMAALFWAVWRLGGIGFGDVRLAPVLGAATAVESWPNLFFALVAGTVLGAAVGILRTALGRRGPFPYGPSLTLGAFAALVFA